MANWILELLLYIGRLLALSLGTVVICGLAVHLCARIFARLWGFGSRAVFDLTALIGTPIHELGHAAMCLLFGHRIERVKLLSLGKRDGSYGYVEHSYNRRNLWARLGNLFIGIGPIFSGLGVIALTLWLCFPAPWADYLALSGALVARGASAGEIVQSVFSLLLALPSAFADNWLLSLLGLVLMMSVSLHVSLSGADIRGSLSALPLYAALTAVIAIVTKLLGFSGTVISALSVFNLCLLSMFSLVIAFAALWVVIAFLLWLVRKIF